MTLSNIGPSRGRSIHETGNVMGGMAATVVSPEDVKKRAERYVISTAAVTIREVLQPTTAGRDVTPSSSKRSILQKICVRVSLEVWRGMFHVWHMFATILLKGCELSKGPPTSSRMHSRQIAGFDRSGPNPLTLAGQSASASTLSIATLNVSLAITRDD